jgi:hypothetical protein
MSYDGGDVFTMMIKQDSRDSNVYDAPSYIPDIQAPRSLRAAVTPRQDPRESPDGAYSYVIDGPCPMSRLSFFFLAPFSSLLSMSNISDLKLDCEEEAGSSEGPERDILMEFVLMEEQQEARRNGPSPFKVPTQSSG